MYLFPILRGCLFGLIFSGNVITGGGIQVGWEILLPDVMIWIIVWIFIIFEERAAEMFGNLDPLSRVHVCHSRKNSILRGIGFWSRCKEQGGVGEGNLGFGHSKLSR